MTATARSRTIVEVETSRPRRWRAATHRVGGWFRALVAAVKPAPDTTEGAVMLGLVLLAIGLALAWLPLAFIVPGGLLVAIGLGFHLRRGD